VAGFSAARGPELIFDLAAVRLAPWAVTLGRVVLLSGLVAGLLALHFTSSRYLFALGRDRVLPRGLGRPAAASLTQSIFVGVVLAGFWYFGVTPASQWAHWLAVGGGIGVLVLLVGASLAALLFLNRAPNGENAWQRFLAPGLSTVAFGALGYLAFSNLAALLGVGGRSVWIVPGALVAAVVLGILVGLGMRLARPVAYAGIGLGGTAVVISPTSPPVPDERTPGAHRPERINRQLSA
jgi:amino acid transporter